MSHYHQTYTPALLTDSLSTLNLPYKFCVQNKLDLWCTSLTALSLVMVTYVYTHIREYIHRDIDTLNSCMFTHTVTTYSVDLTLSQYANKIKTETHNYNTTMLQNFVSVSHRTLIFYSLHSTYF